MVVVNYFLDGEFTTFGIDVLSLVDMDPKEGIDPMARIFPKMTKCTFHKYGPSGLVRKFDGLCLLPLNIVNEKMYVFLWFWMIILAVLTGLSVLYRAAVVNSKRMRAHLLRSQSCLSSKTEIKIIVNKFQLGDWFILYQLATNIDQIVLKDLISSLVREFQPFQPVEQV